MTNAETRTRVLEFQPAQRDAAQISGARSGLDHLRAMVTGDVAAPPISSHVGMRIVHVDEGDVVMTVEPDESHYNPIGAVHGGFFATVLDSVCGCAVHSTLPAGLGYTSLELKVSFLRPVTADTGTVTAHGWVTKGRSEHGIRRGRPPRRSGTDPRHSIEHVPHRASGCAFVTG